MRELRDYFCTYHQSKALMSLDCQYRWVVARYENDNDNILVLLLRSQALDYFRELGWHGYVQDFTAERYVYCINRVTKDAFSCKGLKHIDVVTYADIKNSHEDFNIVELNLIDKLIELEKEARNDK